MGQILSSQPRPCPISPEPFCCARRPLKRMPDSVHIRSRQVTLIPSMGKLGSNVSFATKLHRLKLLFCLMAICNLQGLATSKHAHRVNRGCYGNGHTTRGSQNRPYNILRTPLLSVRLYKDPFFESPHVRGPSGYGVGLPDSKTKLCSRLYTPSAPGLHGRHRCGHVRLDRPAHSSRGFQASRYVGSSQS